MRLGRSLKRRRNSFPLFLMSKTAGTKPNFKIKSLNELILVVQDLGKSKHFYVDILGLKLFKEVPGKIVWVGTKTDDIGLFAPGVLSFGAEHCTGPIHFALEVTKNDLFKAKKYLEGKGYQVQGPISHPGNDLSIYLDDPDRNRVELHIAGFNKQWRKKSQ